MRRNEYLRSRMSGRDHHRGRRPEMRHDDYRAHHRDYDYDYDYDYEYNEPRHRHEPTHYRHDEYAYKHDHEDLDKEYKADLKEWVEKLKRKDKFRLSSQDILHKAKSMGIKFDDYDELEFEATYYMLISDFGNVSNDPHTYLAMAKAFLEDDDIEVSPSEKICIYFYKIVKGE